MKKALHLNQKTYQYKYVEANLYQEMSYFYRYNWNDPDKALEYENKCIEILENWQTKNHYDLLKAYSKRGHLYAFNDDYKAIEDYETALDRCSSYPELASSLYYDLGSIYERLEQPEKSTKCYIRAYYLWQQGGSKPRFGWNNQLLEYVYDQLENPDLDYASWSQEKLNQAGEDLKKKWGIIE